MFPHRKRFTRSLVSTLFIQCLPIFRFTLVPLLTKSEQLNLAAMSSQIRKTLIPYIIPLHLFSNELGPPSETLKPFIKRWRMGYANFFDPLHSSDIDLNLLHYLQISIQVPQFPSLANLSNLRHLGVQFGYRFAEINPNDLPPNVKSINITAPNSIYLSTSNWPLSLISLCVSGSISGPGADVLPRCLRRLRYDSFYEFFVQWQFPSTLEKFDCSYLCTTSSFPDSLTKLIIRRVEGDLHSLPPNLRFLKLIHFSRTLPLMPPSLTHLDLTTYNEPFTQQLPNLIILKLGSYRFPLDLSVHRSLRFLYLPMGSTDINQLPHGCRFLVGNVKGPVEGCVRGGTLDST